MQEIISNTIERICGNVPGDRVRRDEPMSRHTSFRIGGPAAAFVTVTDEKELAAVKAEGRHSAVLVLTDIMKEGSELLVVSDEEDVIIKALGTQKSDNMWMPGVMSRKKQVVPPLQGAFKA